MHGDFSRGHEPDRKRGRNYRRVLLQMGRPLLDSDVAASVDATLGEVQATARGLGCAAGSPDLGFLVTPGRLLAVFAESSDGVRVMGGTPDVWVDYRTRYLDRYPALFVRAAGGIPARLTIPSLQPLQPGAAGRRVALWSAVEQSVTIELNGEAVNLAPTSPDGPTRVEFDVPASDLDPIDIEVPAGGEVWLYLLEQDELATDDPVFWVAPGSYHVDGLIVDAHGGGPFPEHGFPIAAGFPWDASPPVDPPLTGVVSPPGLVPGSRLVAYLDVHERHVTAVEDPGIREEALGPGDTCTRAELLGQVKLAVINGSPSAAAIREAFTRVQPSEAELTIEVASSTPIADPCALPDVAGYSGADNRLYRIEVHRGGSLGQVRLKWSRDNGSELFAAQRDVTGNLVFPAGTPLVAGDLVEVLSNVVDLGDFSFARVEFGTFVPSRRATGQLAQLAALDVASSSDEVAFTLVDPDDTSVPVTLDGRYGDEPEAVLKLRRWHGVIDPGQLAGPNPTSPGPHPLEDGITVLLDNASVYQPGEYWQYEARVRQENANGPWRTAPHGPQRRFAPLALLEFQGESQPVELVAWLDERFSHLCDLTADDISFSGDRVGSSSETVQEALEELLDRTADWPVVVADGINWQNDRPLTFARFREGLAVTFSEEMHPASASPDTFVVTLEVPDDTASPGGRRPVIVDGRVDVNGRTWTFMPGELDAISLGQWAEVLDGSLRCRVRLAGEVILDRAGVRPLDGEAVGQIAEDGYDNFIDLRLPSGDGTRGGDFHSWFYLTPPAPRITIESIEPADDAVVPASEAPAVILISFTGPVRWESLTSDTLAVTRRRFLGLGLRGVEEIPGTVQPYPFEEQPEFVTRVTFAPDDPEALRLPEPDAIGPARIDSYHFTIRLNGEAILDADYRGIDGGRTGTASVFESTFQVRSDG